MSHIGSDLRFASRTLRAKPVFSAVAIVSLALGIGANTAIFSIVESALLRSLPFRNPDRLVAIGDRQPCCASVSLSPGEYQDYQRQSKSFEDIAAIAWQSVTLTGAGEARAVVGRAVTTNFFEVLGARAQIGRLMSSRIDKAGSENRVAVISAGLWRSQFAGDPNILGRTLTLNGRPFTVIGVLAAHEEYPPDVEIWLSPRASVPEFAESAMQDMNISQTYGNHWLMGLGRLRPRVPLARARAEMRTIANRIDAAHDEPGHWAVLVPLQTSLVRSLRPALAVLGTAVLVLLLIACANLIGLMMARATGRTRELAIRVAIGANRWELTRLLLSESFILATAGGLFGVGIAFGALKLLHRYSPYELPPALAPTLNSEVLIFCVAVSFLSALITGFLPALSAGRVDVNEGLKEAGKGSASRGTQRIRRVLVTGEIALSVILLVAAFLLIRSFSNLLAIDPGFTAASVTTAQLSLPRSRYVKPEQVIDFWNRLLARAKTLPGVESAGITSDLPLTGVGSGGDFEVEGHRVSSKDKAPYSYHLYVSPETIGTLHIPLLSGRDFSARDQKNSIPVVIVNKTLADHFFLGQNAIGKRLRTGNDAPWETIVGVVGNVKWDDLSAVPTLDVYRSYTQLVEVAAAALVVRTKGTVLPAADLEAAVRSVDKDVPLSQVKSLTSYVDQSLGQRRFLLGLLTAFSALAMGLAALGLYAVLAYSVQQRRREIGIRVAVGASKSDVLWMVLRECIAIATIGVFGGIVAALWSSALLKSMLFGISDTDLMAYVSAVLLIVSVALAASLIPALRAARVDPVSALRYE